MARVSRRAAARLSQWIPVKTMTAISTAGTILAVAAKAPAWTYAIRQTAANNSANPGTSGARYHCQTA